MGANIYCQKLPERMVQTCPLCGERHPMMIRGLTTDVEDGEIHVANDRGYSFCNCYNIFYTNKGNLDKTLYDSNYNNKYECENIKKIAEFEISKYLEIFKKYKVDISSFFEIGCVTDHVLDVVADSGIKTVGFDIIARECKHEFISGDFESYETADKYDIIHASHVFEHFIDIKSQLIKCRDMLNPGGLLYIAMPDTFYIDWTNNNPLKWDWHVREHYTLWGLDSFIDFAEDNGLKCLHSERGLDLFKQTNGTWFWKQDFKVVLTND